MTKEEVYRLLREANVTWSAVEHPPVWTEEEADGLGLPHPEAAAKCLFLRDDKKRAWYLVLVPGPGRADLAAVREQAGTRRLSFASEEDLLAMTGLRPGSVTPFGALTDPERRVQVLVDAALAEGMVWVHPCENTASVLLPTEELLRVLEGQGCRTQVFGPEALRGRPAGGILSQEGEPDRSPMRQKG